MSVEFDRERFKQLILLVVERSPDDRKLGAVVLNQLLYLCDFEAYRLLGHPIAGARYQKEAYGPFAPVFVPVQDEMIGDDQIEFRRRLRRGEAYVAIVADRPADGVFADAEVEIVDEAALGITRFAPGAAAWRALRIGERIPYSPSYVLAW